MPNLQQFSHPHNLFLLKDVKKLLPVTGFICAMDLATALPGPVESFNDSRDRVYLCRGSCHGPRDS